MTGIIEKYILASSTHKNYFLSIMIKLMPKYSNKIITYLMVLIFIAKLFLAIGWGEHRNLSGDEERNFQIALNHLAGDDYTINGKPTAYHGSFPVFLYEFLVVAGIPKTAFIAVYHVLIILFFIYSIPLFYLLLVNLGGNKKIALVATIIYCIYPTNLFMVSFFTYEKLVLPLIVISFYLIYENLVVGTKNKLIYLVPFIVSLSCLVRAQLIAVYFMLYLFFLIYALRKYRINEFKTFGAICVLTVVLMVGSNTPSYMKNHTMFGSYILSTQSGFEFMHGHNDIANGRFDIRWNQPGNPYYIYSHKMIPGLDTLNEYEESQARMKFGLNWVKENPIKELKLLALKSDRFFLRQHGLVGYNPLNVGVHLSFIVAIIAMIFYRSFDNATFLILAPILGSYILSVLFFPGLRVRYYAEPFFIIFAAYQFSKLAYMKGWIKKEDVSV